MVSRMEFLSINAQNNNYLEPVTKTSVDEFTSISTISTRKLEGQQPVATSRDVVTLVEDFNDSDEDRHTNDSPTAPLVENSSSSSVDTSDTKIDLSLKSRQISLHEALELRRIVFGNVAAAATTGSTARLLSFTEEWKGKGFVFNDLNVLRYGLVQLKVSSKNGGCGYGHLQHDF